MRHRNYPYAENGFMDVCVKLAQTAFFDNLPSNVNDHPPTAPALLPGPMAGAPSVRRRWLAALDDWMHRQQVRERESYLSRSRDVFDLERRIRDLERRPYY